MTQNKSNPFALVSTLSVAAFISSLIVFLKFRDLPLFSFLQKSNVVLYASSLIVFVLSFFFFLLLFSYFRAPVHFFNKALSKHLGRGASLLLFSLSFITVSILLLHRRFVAELSEFAILFYSASIHDFPVFVGVALFILISILALVLFFSGHDIPHFLVWPGYILVAVLCFFSTLTINILAADVHHGVAYLESIFNVYYGTPYNAETIGVYGHYGLFLGLLLRLFDKGIVTVSIMIACLASIVSLCCSFILHCTLKTNWLKIVGTFACSFTVLTLRVNNYYQVQPHRVIFPVLLLAVLVWQCKTKRWSTIYKIFDYILVSCSILWNAESGLFCMIGLICALSVQTLLHASFLSRDFLKKTVIHLFFGLLALLSAIGVEILYNHLCSWHNIDIKLFFAPLFTSSYMDGTLRADMPIQNSAWIYVLVLFSGFLLFSLKNTTWFPSGKMSVEGSILSLAPAQAALATLGLLNFSYYANRAAYYNLDIIIQLAVLALCFLADSGRSHFARLFTSESCVAHVLHRALSACCLTIVSVLCAQAILFSPSLLKTKYEAGHWDTEIIHTICNEIQSNVPKDTYAFGPAITIFYQAMHWDTHAHYTDFSDLTVYGETTKNKIIEEAAQHGSFLTTVQTPGFTDQILEKNPSLKLVWTADIGGLSFEYWSETSGI